MSHPQGRVAEHEWMMRMDDIGLEFLQNRRQATGYWNPDGKITSFEMLDSKKADHVFFDRWSVLEFRGHDYYMVSAAAVFGCKGFNRPGYTTDVGFICIGHHKYSHGKSKFCNRLLIRSNRCTK